MPPAHDRLRIPAMGPDFPSTERETGGRKFSRHTYQFREFVCLPPPPASFRKKARPLSTCRLASFRKTIRQLSTLDSESGTVGNDPGTMIHTPERSERSFPPLFLMSFHTGSCGTGQRSGAVIPTKEGSAFTGLKADPSQARDDPFATFTRLSKPQHNKSRR